MDGRLMLGMSAQGGDSRTQLDRIGFNSAVHAYAGEPQQPPVRDLQQAISLCLGQE